MVTVREEYVTKNKVRIVTAASLFDGHDASINIMRRILQSSGAEVIHLGHNRPVSEIVQAAIQEDAQAIALTSYQGGHTEYFSYLRELLNKENCNHIRIFGGGGGTILPSEIEELQKKGITRLYSPDDGRKLGLQGMINDVLEKSDFSCIEAKPHTSLLSASRQVLLAHCISLIENSKPVPEEYLEKLRQEIPTKPLVLGITGTGGAGKSSLTDELVLRFQKDYPDVEIAILSIDPTRKKTGGALLGDRIRMNSIHHPQIFMRSLATRFDHQSVNPHVQEITELFKAAGFPFIIVETAGIGQSDTRITELADLSLYVMTPEYGAASQLEKIDILDYADYIAINKFDRKGAKDALRDVAKQYQRNHKLFEKPLEEMPIFGTVASRFNNEGVNELYTAIFSQAREKLGFFDDIRFDHPVQKSQDIIPPERVRYLSEIVESSKEFNAFIKKEKEIASKAYRLQGAVREFSSEPEIKEKIQNKFYIKHAELSDSSKKILDNWEQKKSGFRKDFFSYTVRGKEIRVENYFTSLSDLKIPKIGFPKSADWGDILEWNYKENFPGEFPFTSGVYPFKRSGEDPTRMFAGEGGPERTNRRFHYLSRNSEAKRLSTAFDSVTLYGENPDKRPDIYGKIGNSGVSIATLDDAKKLYSGFDLCAPNTSVSMTINGPAPILLAFFFNAAIDQQCEKYIFQNGLEEEVHKKKEELYKQFSQIPPVYRGELPASNNKLGLFLLGLSGKDVLSPEVYENIKKDTIQKVRGTVQADILKEDQAQNTCIFSTEFSLKLMGDIQEYFIENGVRNFYSVSISGYHIAEAGANPISQLAFTLANGFTYVEYYLARGMKIDDFAPNFSFFFSNGMDPEYSVIGRAARRIWAKAMKYKYKASPRSQMLKYHIQTSGRSLHAQEIDFNDIRTTLQALYAIYDNCNSLHTNSYDEAVTTPTEESVRRALAIQLIINRELGTTKAENYIQGSFISDELTDLVEEAVYAEFNRLTERGGVLGAMELMYQRNKIQDESMFYEGQKMSGEYPIIGVNTFLDEKGSPIIVPDEVIRSTDEEKDSQIFALNELHKRYYSEYENHRKYLESSVMENRNVFEALMNLAPYLSLGQITSRLYELGGKYRRNM